MDELEEKYDNNDIGGYYGGDGYSNTTQIDAKIISSDYKDEKFVITVPKYERIKCAHVVMDKNNKIRLFKGHPVIERMAYEKVYVGEETKEFEFPIKNLHNDSVTSSILTDSDVESVRMLDDTIIELEIQMMTQPEASFIKTITRMNSMKASIVNSSKGRWGRAAELSKTQISKGESKNYNFSDIQQMEEFNERKKRKGLFGMGGIGGIF